MLVIMVKKNNKILASFEAWSQTCFDDAVKFIKDNNLKYLEETVTFNGDIIFFVEEVA